MTSPEEHQDLHAEAEPPPGSVEELVRAGDAFFANGNFASAGNAYRDASQIALDGNDPGEIEEVMGHVETFLRDTSEDAAAVAARAELNDWMAERGWSLKQEPVVRDAPKVGRNDACPCGSGRKYKKCHGAGG